MRILVASDSVEIKAEEVIRLKIIDTKKFRGREILEERKKLKMKDGFITVGEPAKEVAKFADAIDVDLIAVDDPDLGLDIAKEVSKPVIIAKDFDNVFERCLIGYNPLVFNDAIRLRIERLPFKEVHIVHVLESVIPQSISPDKISKIVNFMKDVKKKTTRISSYHVKLGEPAKEILKTAEEIDASCIALNTSMKRMSIGSTTQKIAKIGKLPVLVWKELIKRNGFIQSL
ncbi:universal stress protein [Archaeoglobus profundus]|uniref:UspA domain-containing protein n=1 Tax=Archaeoglobus profundus (strain DSM 5631 / JCM 9629 / NBRC 100127 / Av18) TaxID=572546 RepID=D2RES6_ARCPA|nr:universal stress protein [Archaeoglobus profundus]ADB58620.1 hypothetical protein Arcpr_1574 [Archaeoglobus profundus DSM 5631]